jgi:cobalt-precorrin-5B (C1)-methyltransferase
MMEKFVLKGNKKLRYGYTTGSCAAAAAKVCVLMLLERKTVDTVSLDTPKGFLLKLEVLEAKQNSDYASCGIKKDSGDDPDITDGIVIYAKVKKATSGIAIYGGVGIGKVTKLGLSVAVGKSAINPVPIKMIEDEVKKVCADFGYKGGLDIEIYTPDGEAIAKKTFNAKLGIVGGISILGSTGIVEPMSEDAIKETMYLELDVIRAKGEDKVLFCPGNYGYHFAKDVLKLNMTRSVKISNYIGDMVDKAKEKGFKKILFVSHIGKAVKVAGGMMNTHSKYGDCRKEIFCAKAIEAKCSLDVASSILACTTTDGMIDVVKKKVQYDDIKQRILNDIMANLSQGAFGEIEFSVVIFSNQHGLLAKSDEAKIKEFLL